MAIQTINLTVPGGDTPRSANTKINANFSNSANAAKYEVGTGSEQIPLGRHLLESLHSKKPILIETGSTQDFAYGASFANTTVTDRPAGHQFSTIYTYSMYSTTNFQFAVGYTTGTNLFFMRMKGYSKEAYDDWSMLYTDKNTTKDSNGFIKRASPVVDLYSDRVELNADAEEQGIAFEKVGTGDYMVKGSLGFAQEGWYIEMPKDANGNVLVAVVYEQLENNDISVKTYAKTFDMDTGDVVPNLSRPRDIPEGRFVSLRLHEEPKL